MIEGFLKKKRKLTDEEAKIEASRCLLCDDPPCTKNCPAEVEVKKFIRAIRFDNPRRAIDLIKSKNVFAGTCGLICPTEKLCEKGCTQKELLIPVRIGDLQRYSAEWEFPRKIKTYPQIKFNKKSVAVIGAGPSGLSAASELVKNGFDVTVFEKKSHPGGLLIYGIPSYRLPSEIVENEIEWIKKIGVKIRLNQNFGKDFSITDLFNSGFKAIYIACGLPNSSNLQIDGEKLDGVHYALPFLEKVSMFSRFNKEEVRVGKKVVVIGGGGVAMDCATSAKLLGAEDVLCVCLEGLNEMPASEEEKKIAIEEGVQFITRSKPLQIVENNGKVAGLKGCRIRWKEPYKFIPSNAEEIIGTEFNLIADTIIVAIGQKPDRDLTSSLEGVNIDGNGYIITDPVTFMTSRKGVFAGGDCRLFGGQTVVNSVKEGRIAAKSIAKYIFDVKPREIE